MPGHFTFYCNKIEGEIAYFEEAEAKHAIQVLRYVNGDEIWFTNGQGSRFKGVIDGAKKTGFQAKIVETFLVDPPVELCLLMAILKAGDRMEWAMEKCTELGVTEFLLFQSDHGERGKANLDRLKKVALSAMKQSHGAWLPNVQTCSFQEALNKFAALDSRYIAYCGDAEKSVMGEICLPAAVMIGPEGDFSEREMGMAFSKGWKALALGNQILRTETAAVSVCAALRMR